jgi:hypothetical protein
MSVTNFRKASFKKGLPKTSKFADIPGAIATPSIVTAGLVRWYDAGNTSSYPGTGTTWTDLQGSGYNLTLQNGPTFTSSGVGSYFTFDGSNDYILFPNSDVMGSVYTQNIWFKKNSSVLMCLIRLLICMPRSFLKLRR